MNGFGWMGVRRAGVAMAAGLLFAGVAWGEPSAADKALVERLNSPEWAVREAASTELAQQGWDSARLREMYQIGGSMEAKERVLACGRQQYFSSLMQVSNEPGKEARLGVMRTPQVTMIQPAGSLSPVRALFVASPVCGMPAAIVIKPGDRILKVDQIDLTQLPAETEPFDVLTKRVLEGKSGDVLGLVIERDGQKMEVNVALGSLAGMVLVEQPKGFGPYPRVLDAWAAEKAKITAPAVKKE